MSQAKRLCVLAILACTSVAAADNRPIVLSDDAGWCWFEDERTIISDGHLIVGTVADGRYDRERRGSVEVVTYDLGSGEKTVSVLHHQLEPDDHDSPALLVLADGRILAAYCKHGRENKVYYRISRDAGDDTQWLPEKTFVPSEESRVTYSNLILLTAENEGRGRIYNFFRGYDDHWNPSCMTSDDRGETWLARGVWIDSPAASRQRPYVKYASDGQRTIHFLFTEGHPRVSDNSIFHAFYRSGTFFRSDGTRIKRVVDGPLLPSEASLIFRGDSDNVAWASDLHLDKEGHPVAVYSVRKNAAGSPPKHRNIGRDLRYRYARWCNGKWRDHEIAYAGSRLYPGEDDYSGNICLDPAHPERVYLSSNVTITDGSPNASGHYEIYQGVTTDCGRSWSWKAVTSESGVDNIRPLVPLGNATQTAVLWLRGQYYSYTDFKLSAVAVILPPTND